MGLEVDNHKVPVTFLFIRGGLEDDPLAIGGPRRIVIIGMGSGWREIHGFIRGEIKQGDIAFMIPSHVNESELLAIGRPFWATGMASDEHFPMMVNRIKKAEAPAPPPIGCYGEKGSFGVACGQDIFRNRTRGQLIEAVILEVVPKQLTSGGLIGIKDKTSAVVTPGGVLFTEAGGGNGNLTAGGKFQNKDVPLPVNFSLKSEPSPIR